MPKIHETKALAMPNILMVPTAASLERFKTITSLIQARVCV